MPRTVGYSGWVAVLLAGCAGPNAKIAWSDAARLERPLGVSRPAGGPALTEADPLELPANLPQYELVAPDIEVVSHPPVGLDQPRALEFAWPLPSTGINSLYGPRHDPFDASERFHYGVDLEGRYGEVVRAAADGWVSAAEWQGGHGRRVVVEHAGGYRTSYSHLAQTLVFPGTRVLRGQALGYVGTSGRSTGAHLHFEVTLDGLHMDPIDVMGRTVRLD